MAKKRAPRRGSLQFWPRKRAAKEVARVRSWNTEQPGLTGFFGYKAGMISIAYKDPRKNAPTKDEVITHSATILECPPIIIRSVRFYHDPYQGQAVKTDFLNPSIPKTMTKFISKPSSPHQLPDTLPDNVSEIRVILATQPYLTGIGKKKPDFFEVKLGGSLEEQFKWVKENLDKEIPVSEVFNEGEVIDLHGVTKGKGFQGTIKRYGIKLLSHKSEKKKRGQANLGAWTPSKVLFSVPQPGKMGYHLRTEYNKLIFKIQNKEDQHKPIHKYGVLKSDYIIIKGSIQGPKKRGITITKPVREKKRLAYKIEPIQ